MRRSTRLRSRESEEGDERTNLTGKSTKRRKSGGASLVEQQPQPQSEQRAAWGAFLQATYLFRAPEELFDVFELAAVLRPDSPCDAFVDTLGVQLCGPFDVLSAAYAKEITIDKPLHLHGRFFSDPPEVAAVMVDVASTTGCHWGFFRDSPDQVPEYIVSTEDSSVCKFEIAGASLFQMLSRKLEGRRSTLQDDVAADLLAKIAACQGKASLSSGQSVSQLRSKRTKESVAASLHQLGIVVPMNAKTNTGYRELPTTGKSLQDLLLQVEVDAGKKSPGSARKMLSELITRATIASDECDFGTGLLLGLDLFTAGPCLEKESLQLLRVAYMLLRRSDFYKIASSHCKHRTQVGPHTRIQAIVPQSEPDAAEGQPTRTKIALPPSLAGRK